MLLSQTVLTQVDLLYKLIEHTVGRIPFMQKWSHLEIFQVRMYFKIYFETTPAAQFKFVLSSEEVAAFGLASCLSVEYNISGFGRRLVPHSSLWLRV